MEKQYTLKATKGQDEKSASGPYPHIMKETKNLLLQGYKVLILAPRCKHQRMNSSSGGWHCSDCGAMWNSKGNLIRESKNA